MTLNTESQSLTRHGLALRWAAAAAVVIAAAVAVRALAGADSPAPDDAAAATTPPSATDQSAEPTDRMPSEEPGRRTTGPGGQDTDDVAMITPCEMGDGLMDPLKAAIEDLFADGTLDCDPFPLIDDTDTESDGGSPHADGGSVPLSFDLPDGWTSEHTDDGVPGFLSPDGTAVIYGDTRQRDGGSLEDYATGQLHGVIDIADDVEHMRLVPDRFLGRDALRAEVEYTLAGGQVTEQAFTFEHGGEFVVVGVALAATDTDSDAARLTRLREVLETVELPS